MNMPGWKILLAIGLSVEFAASALGQWVPPAELRSVPVKEDCRTTHHGVGVSVQPTLFFPKGAIFLCPERMHEIDAAHPGASRFFLVHEYGHLALRTREEAAADEWAARQLSAIEPATLKAAILHFIDEGQRFDPLYGSGLDRALRVARAGRIPKNQWPDQLTDYERREATGQTLALHMKVGYANASQMTVFIDGKAIGFLSNLDRPAPLSFPSLSSGSHQLELTNIWVYHAEPDGKKSEISRSLNAETNFQSTGNHPLVLDVDYDSDDLEIRVEER
jgi:hypothetical protein